MSKGLAGAKNPNYKHGMTGTPEFRIWSGMKERCYNPNAQKYSFYGGRGIFVSARWLASFQNFYDDMGPRPSPKHQLDREDNDGPYEKGNCRWILPKENSSNTRRNVKFTYEGEELTISEIARRSGIHLETLRSRLKTGLTIEEALYKKKWSKPK